MPCIAAMLVVMRNFVAALQKKSFFGQNFGIFIDLCDYTCDDRSDFNDLGIIKGRTEWLNLLNNK